MKFLPVTIFSFVSIAVAAPDGARYFARDNGDQLSARDLEARQCVPGGFPCLSDRWCCSGNCVSGVQRGNFPLRLGRCGLRSTTSHTSSTTRTSTLPTTTVGLTTRSTTRTSMSSTAIRTSTTLSTTRATGSSLCTDTLLYSTSSITTYEYRGFTYTGYGSVRYATSTIITPCDKVPTSFHPISSTTTTSPFPFSTTTTRSPVIISPTLTGPASSLCVPSYITSISNGQTQVYTSDPPCAFPTSTKLIHSGCPPVMPMVMTTVVETAAPTQRSGTYYLGFYSTTLTYTSQPPCAGYPVQHSCSPSYRYGITETYSATVDARGNTQGISFFPTTITYTSYPESCPTVASPTSPLSVPTSQSQVSGIGTYSSCGPNIVTTTSVLTSNGRPYTITQKRTDYVPCPTSPPRTSPKTTTTGSPCSPLTSGTYSPYKTTINGKPTTAYTYIPYTYAGCLITAPSPTATTYPLCGPTLRTTTSVLSSNGHLQPITLIFTTYVPCPSSPTSPRLTTTTTTTSRKPTIITTTSSSSRKPTTTTTPCVASTRYFTETITELSVSAKKTVTATRTQTYTAIYDPPCAFGGH